MLGEQKIIHAPMLLCDWQANLGKEARTPDTFLRAARRIFFFNFVLSGSNLGPLHMTDKCYLSYIDSKEN